MMKIKHTKPTSHFSSRAHATFQIIKNNSVFICPYTTNKETHKEA